MRTQHYTLGSVGGNREGQQGVWSWGERAWGEMPDIGEGGGRQQMALPHVYLCSNLACSSHVPQNLKCNKKNKFIMGIFRR